jgi:multidrug efflux pump
LQADTVEELYGWTPRILAELQRSPPLADVNSDQQDKGLETRVTIDRDTVARLGINVAQIDNTLYDAYGQRQVSTIYKTRQQYHVIMEVAPRYWQDPETLRDIFVSKAGGNATGTQTANAVAGTVSGPPTVSSSSVAAKAATVAADAVRNLALNSIGNTGKGATSTGSAVSTNAEAMVPLGAVAHFSSSNIPLAVSHQGLFVATTMSFNLPIGVSLSDTVTAVNEAMKRLGVPVSIHGSFQGTDRAYEESLKNEPYLILAALVAVYIVLGVLYESSIHPITILSTLPSAGVGAVLALMICKTEFSIISLIGVILLTGLTQAMCRGRDMLAVSFSTFDPEEKLPECQQLIFCDNGNGSATLYLLCGRIAPASQRWHVDSRRGPACASTNVVGGQGIKVTSEERSGRRPRRPKLGK